MTSESLRGDIAMTTITEQLFNGYGPQGWGPEGRNPQNFGNPQSFEVVANPNELFSRFNNYRVKFRKNSKLNAAQKTTVLAGQLLIDYMIRDAGNYNFFHMRSFCVGDCFVFDLSACSMFGCIIPCSVCIPLIGLPMTCKWDCCPGIGYIYPEREIGDRMGSD